MEVCTGDREGQRRDTRSRLGNLGRLLGEGMTPLTLKWQITRGQEKKGEKCIPKGGNGMCKGPRGLDMYEAVCRQV